MIENKDRALGYDLVAHLYSYFTGLLFLVSGYTESTFRRRLFYETLPRKSQDVILDLCCANGKGTQIISLIIPESIIYAIDKNPHMIYYSSKNYRNFPNLNFRVGDCAEIPFNNSNFNMVTAVLALHELPTELVKKTLQEIYRVLKPEGILYLFDFIMPKNPSFIQRIFYYILRLFEDESAAKFMLVDQQKLIEQEGFKQIFQKEFIAGFTNIRIFKKQ